MVARKREEPYKTYFNTAYLSIGQGLGFGYEALSSITGLPITRDNIIELKPQIVERLKDASPLIEGEHISFHDAYTVITAINELIASGVDVYLAAGNSGAAPVDMVNPLAFSNAHVVGATDAAGRIADFSSVSSLVDTYERGTFGVLPVFDKNGAFQGITYHGADAPLLDVRSVGDLQLPQAITKYAGKPVPQDMTTASSHQVSQALQAIKELPDYDWTKGKKEIQQKYTPVLRSGDLFQVDADFHRLNAALQMTTQPTDIELAIKTELEAIDYTPGIDYFVTWDPDQQEWLKFQKAFDGKLIMDLDNSGLPGQVALIAGTSFAAPTRARMAMMGNPPLEAPKPHVASNKQQLTMLADAYGEILEDLRKYNLIRHGQSFKELDPKVWPWLGISQEEGLQLEKTLTEYVETGYIPLDAAFPDAVGP
jgi:hypothetical protein